MEGGSPRRRLLRPPGEQWSRMRPGAVLMPLESDAGVSGTGSRWALLTHCIAGAETRRREHHCHVPEASATRSARARAHACSTHSDARCAPGPRSGPAANEAGMAPGRRRGRKGTLQVPGWAWPAPYIGATEGESRTQALETV